MYKSLSEAENSSIGEQYAILSTSKDQIPPELGYTLPVIMMEPKQAGETIKEPCRIDFSQTQTVEHDAKVQEFGNVHPDYIKPVVNQWVKILVS
jgi:hypothetical protein